MVKDTLLHKASRLHPIWLNHQNHFNISFENQNQELTLSDIASTFMTTDTAIRIDLHSAEVVHFTHMTWIL